MHYVAAPAIFYWATDSFVSKKPVKIAVFKPNAGSGRSKIDQNPKIQRFESRISGANQAVAQ
jgi:hypothetical protein